MDSPTGKAQLSPMTMTKMAAAALATLALASCKPAAPQPPLDPQAEPIARAFFDEVRTGANLDASPHLAHELKNPTTEDQLNDFRDLIPPQQQPTSIQLKSSQVQVDSTGTTTRLAEAYTYPDRTLIVQTALFKSPSGVLPVIIGFKVTLDQGAG